MNTPRSVLPLVSIYREAFERAGERWRRNVSTGA